MQQILSYFTTIKSDTPFQQEIEKPDPLPSIEPIQYMYHQVTDVTERVKKSPPPPCFGREDIVEWLATVFASPNKNAVLLTGSPGVGKSLLIDHLAWLIVTNKAPPGLANRRILLIKLKHKCVFETLSEKYKDHCILVADEVHTLISNTSKTASLFHFNSDSLNPEELKPCIGSGKVPFLGLTDRPYEILQDAAWQRRFQRKELTEISIESACKLTINAIPFFVRQLYNSLQIANRINTLKIDPKACEAAVKLSFIYLKDEYLPDKTSKILEPACVTKIRTAIDEEQVDICVTEADVIRYTMRAFKVTEHEINAKLENLEQDLALSIIPANAPLLKYTTNLTALASKGKILPVYGREKELNNVKAALSGVESNNVMLVGPAGCGKTRLAEGLAYDIWKGDNVHVSLKGKVVLLLNLATLLADTKYRGEIEKKVDEFLTSAREYEGHIILVVDEIHRIIGTGGAEGSRYNVADEFKEILARGKLPTLGMTTRREFEIIRTDEAFLRRFQKQELEPFSPSQTMDTFKRDRQNFINAYSNKNQRSYTIQDNAFEAAAYLAPYYLKDEFLPASAYKIFHGACAARSFDAPQDGSALVIQESDILDHVNQVYTTLKDQNSLEAVGKQLLRLKAELHPSNQLIPIQEPLIKFCENWTNFARQEMFKKISNREGYLKELYKILSCRTVNNLLVLGPPGSGKTTFIQALAIEMAAGNVPEFLKGKLLLSLKASELLQACRASSSKLTELIESAQKYAGKFVLFVDEIHILFEATIDGVSVIELFKPLLAEGKLRLIGATTHKSQLMNSASIARRFQAIQLPELTIEQTVEVLEQSKKRYEEFYGQQYNRIYNIDSQCLKSVALKAKEVWHNQALPASAIKMIEEVCAEEGLNAMDEQKTVEIRDGQVVAYSEKINVRPSKKLAQWSWSNAMFGLASRVMRLFSRFKGILNYLHIGV